MLITRASRAVLIAGGALALVGGACGSEGARPSRAQPSGPSEVRPEVIERHAAQLDRELADRPAGSQEEQAASQYVLGHLQRAGYFVRLEAVPVGHLLESTNLVAAPPSGVEAHTVVTVAYDAEAAQPPTGEAVGLFLELARALYAAQPRHRVEFVALGADRSTERLGSRRYAQQLTEEGRSPTLISLEGIEQGAPVVARGPGASELSDLAGRSARAQEEQQDGVFDRAGFDHLSVAGDPARVGSALLAYLGRGEE
jgi:hypothetical protein